MLWVERYAGRVRDRLGRQRAVRASVVVNSVLLRVIDDVCRGQWVVTMADMR
jgi:hypothetical protein